MGNPVDRIHAALLRSKEPVQAARQVAPHKPVEIGRQIVTVVVNEQNLAALASSIVELPHPKAPGAGLGAGRRD